MSKEVGIEVLVESKKTYTELFTSQLRVPIYKVIEEIYEEAEDYIESHPDSETGVLYEFQSGLKDITRWNEDNISSAVNKIAPAEKTKRFDDLLEAVVISNVKIMTAIRLNNKNAPLDLTIPTIKKFIYNTLVEAARRFYENPYLFDRTSDPIEQQKNLEKAYLIINNAIQTTINNSIPTDEILEKALEKPDPNEIPDDVSMYTSASTAEDRKKGELRDLIRKELESVLSEYVSDDEDDDEDDGSSKRSQSPAPSQSQSGRSVSMERVGEIHSGSESETDLKSDSDDGLKSESESEKSTQDTKSEDGKSNQDTKSEDGKSSDSKSNSSSGSKNEVRDIIVPASNKYATQKAAEQKVDQIKKTRNFDSDTVFFSDSD